MVYLALEENRQELQRDVSQSVLHGPPALELPECWEKLQTPGAPSMPSAQKHNWLTMWFSYWVRFKMVPIMGIALVKLTLLSPEFELFWRLFEKRVARLKFFKMQRFGICISSACWRPKGFRALLICWKRQSDSDVDSNSTKHLAERMDRTVEPWVDTNIENNIIAFLRYLFKFIFSTPQIPLDKIVTGSDFVTHISCII